MPPKRKAASSPSSPQQQQQTPAKKAKTLAERREEARAKAQLYAAGLKAKKEAKSAPTAPAAAAASSSTAPKPAAKPSKPAAKRSRKSTGDLPLPPSDGSASSSRSPRRASAGRKRARPAAVSGFEFEPVVEETSERGGEGTGPPPPSPNSNSSPSPMRRRRPSGGPSGTPVARADGPFESGGDEGRETAKEAKSSGEREASERKKEEALRRDEEYAFDLARKGRRLDGGPGSPPAASGGRAAPPAVPSGSAPPPSTAAPRAASLEARTAAPRARSAAEPPAAVARIFSPAKKYAAHRPALRDPDSGFDPDEPFPKRGYRMPTAAYCGCGPTPAFSYNGAVRGGDLCPTDTGGSVGSDAAAARLGVKRKESYSSVLGGMNEKMPAADPPYASRRGSAKVDESEEERREEERKRADPEGVRGSAVRADNVAEEPAQFAPAVETEPSPPAAAPGASLGESIAKARAMMSHINDSNRKRRAALGIKFDARADAADNVAVQVLRRQQRRAESPKENAVAQMMRQQREIGPRDPVGAAGSLKLAEVGAMERANVGRETNENLEREGLDEEEDRASAPALAKRILKKVLIGLFVAMILQMAYGVFYFASNHIIGSAAPSSNQTNTWSSKFLHNDKPLDAEPKQMQCFIDHPADFFTPGETVDEESCAGKFAPCPQWGRCHRGKLRDCDDAEGRLRTDGVSRFVPNASGDGCIPGEEAMEVVHLIVRVLADMTVDQHCNVWDKLGTRDVIHPEGRQYPLFRLEKVAERLRIRGGEQSILNETDVSTQLLLWLRPVNSSDLQFGSFSAEEDVVDAIGLSDSVSPNSLPFPIACSIRTMSWELFLFSFGVVGYVAKVAWYCMLNYTLSSTIVLGVCYIVSLYMKRKRRLAKIQELFEPVLEAAYDRLAECDNNEGYAALMLRDDIGRDMYPTNLREREFLYTNVWPRVIFEVHGDNRVRKFRKEANGKNLEHWDLHRQSKKGRILRKSLGSTPKLDAGVSPAPTDSRDP